MQVEYSDSFHKSVKKVKDKIAIKRLDVLIEKLKKANSLKEIPNVIPLTNVPFYYRIRIGDYRLIVWQKDIHSSIELLLIEYLKRVDNTYRNYN